MEISTLGIELGKTTCSIAGLDGNGAVELRKRIQRHRLQDFLARLAHCIVASLQRKPAVVRITLDTFALSKGMSHA